MFYLVQILKTNQILFLIFRISSVLIVQTSYVPDEYWQSLEVAHRMVFGYGYLTWEWKNGLRSYIYPFIFAIFYKLLALFELDTPVTLTILPRTAQAVLTAISDNYFFHLCKSIGCKTYWIKLFIFTNWFCYFCSSRTILNMFEMSLTIIALYYYPFNIFHPNFVKESMNSIVTWPVIKNQSLKCFTLVILNCIVRPTAITIWAPLILYQIIKLYPKRVIHLIFYIMFPIALSLIFISVSIDYFWYKKFTFPPYNFFIFNIYSGIASFYGAHPWHWYITQGIPVVMGLHIIPFTMGCYIVIRRCMRTHRSVVDGILGSLLLIIVFNVLIFSVIPHKEFRFILPLLPMMELIAIRYTTDSKTLNSRNILSYWWTYLLIIAFIIPTTLFGIFHQKGALSAISYLSDEACKHPNGSSYLFLTPCHSIPMYSHLHVNVPVRFLTCEPPLTANDVDESDEFFSRPHSWLENYWHTLGNVSHVICFDSARESIDSFLGDKGLTIKRCFLHTIFTGMSSGDYVLIYER